MEFLEHPASMAALAGLSCTVLLAGATEGCRLKIVTEQTWCLALACLENETSSDRCTD